MHWFNIIPMPNLDASVSNMNRTLKSGNLRTGAEIIAFFNFEKASLDELKQSFLSRSMSGEAIVA